MNRRRIFILLSFLLILSCKENKKKSFEDKVHPDDTYCFNEIDKAKKDFSNNKLIYCHSVGSITHHELRSKKEADSLFKMNKIDFEYTASSDIVEVDKTYGCYCKFMKEQINEKFGDKFVDSLLFSADSLYILKHLDKTYEYGQYENALDKAPLYVNDSTNDATNHSGLQMAFESLVKYPKGYIFNKDKRSSSFMYVDVFIDEIGQAKINNISFYFWNDDAKKENDRNKVYYSYFRNLAVQLIEQRAWTPAKIKNISVKSKNLIFIYLK